MKEDSTKERGIFAENNGGDFEQIEPGSYVARCYRMIDLGTQRAKAFGTDDIQLRHEVLIYFEILEDENNESIRMRDGRPFSVQKRYKLSMHPKATLRKDLDAWRGTPFTDEESKRFNVIKLLGTYCRVSLVPSKDGKYININTVSYTKRKPEGPNELLWWSPLDEEADMTVFDTFPDWLKEKINSCEELLAPEERLQKQPKQEEKMPQSKVEETFFDGEQDSSEVNLEDIPF